ncbi:MAG TPA: hypothetical protein VF774_13610, partial [Pseudoduganella sp.]
DAYIPKANNFDPTPFLFFTTRVVQAAKASCGTSAGQIAVAGMRAIDTTGRRNTRLALPGPQ